MDFLKAGVSIVGGIIPSIIKASSSYYQSMKKDKEYINTIKNLQGKEETEKIGNRILSSIEPILIESDFISKEIDKNYNLRELPFFVKYIYKINEMELRIKNRIGEIIKNYNFENVEHFNILFLGDNNDSKNSLINSISPIIELYDLKEEKKSEENEKCVSNNGKDLRLLDYKEKEINIENIKKLIEEESYNNNQNNFIHCIWYLLEDGEIEEKKNIAKLVEYFDDILPIIVIIDNIKVKEELENQIKEKPKNFYIFLLKSDKKEDNIKENMKTNVEELVDISKRKIQSALKSPCFYTYILKNINKNENNKLFSEIKKIIEERVNCFLSGNKIKNIHLLNHQIIKIIIKKLLNIKKIDLTAKRILNNLFQKFENIVLTEAQYYFDKAFGNCNYDELFKFIEPLENKDNQDDIDVYKEFAILTNIFSNNVELKSKLKILFIDIVVKSSSYYIDCKITEEIIKSLNESFNSKIKDFSEDIKNKLNLNS